MKNTDCINARIASVGVLPVINVPEERLAVPLAEALMAGGMTALEITLRSECSLAAIEQIKREYPDFLVGAGTVLTEADVDKALAAGADFVVSPGFDPEVVDYCNSLGVLIVPGCATPSEIQQAVKRGLTVIKFFPAELSGGVAAIKLLSGPFKGVRFVPTGGITFENLGAYIATGKVLACGGSFMATASQVKDGRFDEITDACKRAVDIARDAKKG